MTDLTPEAVKAALAKLAIPQGKFAACDCEDDNCVHDIHNASIDFFRGYARDLAREYLRLKEVEKAAKELAEWADLQWCDHSETYRGGTIWEICSICGRMWADDEGGRPENEGEEPDQITAFRAAVEGK